MTTKAALEEYADPGQLMRGEAIQQALGLGLMGTGIHAGIVGLQHLRNLVGDTFSRPPRPMLRRTLMKVPVPAQGLPPDEDEDEAPALPAPSTPLKVAAARMARVVKAAAGESPPPTAAAPAGAPPTSGGVAPSITSTPPTGGALGWIQNALGAGAERNAVGRHLWPEDAAHSYEMPGFLPLALGTYLATKPVAGLVDYAFKARRKADRESELAAAQDRYHRALMGQYDKDAADGGLAAKLDRLFEKAAIVGLAEGVGLAGLLGLGYGAGQMTYDYMDENSPARQAEKALRQREEELFESAPAPIVAIPVPERRRAPRWHMPLSQGRHIPIEPKLAAEVDIGRSIGKQQGILQRRTQYWSSVMNPQPPAKAPARPAAPAAPAPAPPPTAVA